jgi:hypothetical protein
MTTSLESQQLTQQAYTELRARYDTLSRQYRELVEVVDELLAQDETMLLHLEGRGLLTGGDKRQREMIQAKARQAIASSKKR